MAKRIRVRGIARSEPDVRLYIMALLELVRQLDAEDVAARDHGSVATPPGPEMSRE
jgi:hypothetical protein